MSNIAYPPDVPTQASVARVYDYVLGGKDNFAIDREFGDALLASDPEMRITAKLNKEFGRRVVEYLARQGVRQFIDLGSGIPTSPPSIHEAAREIRPDANVVYVDHDPVVVAHNQALRAIGPGLSVIHDSFLEAEAVFSHPDFTSNIDLTEPVAVLFLSVFQNSADEQVHEVLDGIKSRVAPGSYLAITHVSDRTASEVKETARKGTAKGTYPHTRFRSDEQLEAFFNGLELVPPGVVDYRDWRPSEATTSRPQLTTLMTGAVGRFR